MNVYFVILFFWSLGKVEPTLFDWLWSWVVGNTQATTSKETFGLTEGTDVKITCVSPKLYHRWYQRSDNYRLIGNIPLQEGVHKTVFIINVEKFDNNTEIFCMKHVNDNLKSVKLKAKFNINGPSYRNIIITNNTLKKIEEPTVLRYSETKKVSFSCEEYVNKYPCIGVINMTTNFLNTFDKTSTNNNFNKTHNGTVLCCIYYIVTESKEEKIINRYVAKKTLLLYHDDYQQNSLEGFTDTDRKTYILYVTLAVALAITLLVICTTIYVCKKRYTKKPNSDTRVLYVDLDLLRQAESFHGPDPQEESPYAEIIGEIRPPH